MEPLRSLSSAALCDIGHVLVRLLAEYGNLGAVGHTCRFYTARHIPLDPGMALGDALARGGPLLSVHIGACYVTMAARGFVDPTGMQYSVEVVGKKYAVEIGEFGPPPYSTSPAKIWLVQQAGGAPS